MMQGCQRKIHELVVEAVSSDSTGAPERGQKFAFIVNPTAGNARKIDPEFLLAVLRDAGHEAIWQVTQVQGDAQKFARESDADLVVAVGGDGTVNEVVNGLLEGKASTFSVIPTGTANVLATDLGIRPQQDEVLSLLGNGKRCTFWPGITNGQAFAAMTSVGFDADVVAAVDRNKSMKIRYGRFAYVIEALRLFIHMVAMPVLTISVDGAKYS